MAKLKNINKFYKKKTQFKAGKNSINVKFFKVVLHLFHSFYLRFYMHSQIHSLCDLVNKEIIRHNFQFNIPQFY